MNKRLDKMKMMDINQQDTDTLVKTLCSLAFSKISKKYKYPLKDAFILLKTGRNVAKHYK